MQEWHGVTASLYVRLSTSNQSDAWLFFVNRNEILNQRYMKQKIQPWILTECAYYSFFTSPDEPSILEVERTSIALNADDVR